MKTLTHCFYFDTANILNHFACIVKHNQMCEKAIVRNYGLDGNRYSITIESPRNSDLMFLKGVAHAFNHPVGK